MTSVVAVASASSTYTVFVYLRRGHLVHLDVVMKVLGSKKGKQKERERAIESITSNSDL